MSAERLPNSVTNAFRVGVWLVDPSLDQISRGQETVRLEPRTMRLLVRLAETPGQVVSSRELLDTVWAGVVVGPASVYQAISQLRKLLGDTDPEPTFIATVPRKGYRLVAPVERLASVATEPRTPPTPPIEEAKEPRSPRLRWGLAALLIVTLGLGTWFALRDSGPTLTAGLPAPAAQLDSRAIVVAPLAPATQDAETQSLAPIVTDLLRNRLAGLQDLVVIASGSIENAMQSEQNLQAVTRKVRARYLLRGDVTQASKQVRVNVVMVDVESGSPLWSRTFEQPVEQLAAINGAVVAETAKSLQIAIGNSGGNASTDIPTDLSTYELYLRGQQLMSTFRGADADQAAIIFSRVTTLDPSFARGYYAYGQALMLSADLGARKMSEELTRQAGQAIDRAIELNPALGPAWAQRARLTSDPVQAEQMYRRALQLAPSYDENYIRYSDFLFSQGRRGEALELIDRARRIDPLSASLCWRQAQLVLATRSDVDGMKRLLHEALQLRPDFPTALRDLANAEYMWHGNFAEAIRLMERAKTVDTNSYWADAIIAELYLEVGDVAAASSLMRDTRPVTKWVAKETWISMPLYQRDLARAADMARTIMHAWLPPASDPSLLNDSMRVHAVQQELIGWYWPTAIAIRDHAIQTGDFRSALDLIERTTQLFSGPSLMRNRGLMLTYAHALLLAGETQRGRDLLTSLLQQLDAEQIGRPPHMFAWERAVAFALLGNDERALTELAASQKSGRYAGWWYTAELDPVYSRIRPDPRFQALAARARAHRDQQRALLDKMRASGEVPTRK
ncbi:winged helix-turn-helix domain-containing protein [Steroidobacter sp. S1-65]|uniref:Winged helix-turn-helix domain-containing protein n=1 Tax=Steroidobacter gossypii TaxID=2805490 RepID=A0ABS1WQM6_9GAMM|nr:winged helix-turn-helix domain-containing protein [Steroidobacter gossypii]MBM0103279.1 winged helix-turn-helix domain-containing protein [Steroidobacter gossypii]